ncbi:PREDICTED: prostaglandin E synthase 2-like [Acropora digitifera]|uniref:prostaglandin E synthase 2-like n=1 Tax=Acropora digitifera TaxID=70779 RepID=UPI000779F7DC|nr:PREDICTED: prostaglandin E synthase 2-like [Acropora digitifera]
MAARRVLRLKLCHLLNKPSGNVGINSSVRRQITSSSQEWNRFGSNHRLKALLAGGCGVTLATAGFLTFRMFSGDAKARPVRFSEIESGKILREEYPKLSVTLYQYQNCPFCGKVRAFLDYYGIDYTIVEVSPIWKKEISFSAYKKVPLVIANNKQINDSSVIISALRSVLLGQDSVEQILIYYPEIKMQKADGKEEMEFANKYFIMHKGSIDKESTEREKEERKWRKWVDNTFVHTLSPNIYRTPAEAMQAFEYFTKQSNFSTFEKYSTYLAGPFIMYVIGKHVKNKYNLPSDVRLAMYEEAEKWVRALGRRKFMGGSAPNLADLAVYGVLSGLEGLDTFQDLMANTSLKPWYYRVKEAVQIHAGARDM